MRKLKYLFITLLFALPGISFGKDATTEASIFEQYQVEIVLGLAVLVCLVAIMAMYVMLVAMKTILRARRSEMGLDVQDADLISVKEGEEGVSFTRRLWNRLNDSVPVALEEQVATDHEYDGIRELDNRLPPWWLYGFYFTILFAVVYLFRFFFLDMPTQDQEYQAAMQEGREQVKVYLASLDNLIDESSVTLSTETADINAGKAIYDANCAVCHAADGGGGVGPNFTDKYWLHGGDIASIFKTIKYGVPTKGMISWETQLSPKKMQQVASYIYTLEGTTPAKPKEPQGELFEREAATEEGIEESVDNPNAVDDEADLEEGECC